MAVDNPSPADDTSNSFASAASMSSTAAATASADRPAGRQASRAPAAWPSAVAALLRGFNHVMRQHAWARDRFAPFAGQTVRIIVNTPLGEVAASALIAADGTFQAADVVSAPAVTLTARAPLDAFVAAAAGGTAAAMQHLRIEGDAALASAIGQVAPHLRWDAEDDLARIVGDVTARRLTRFFDRARDGMRDWRMRTESTAVQYLLHENPQLVSKPMLDDFRGAVRILRDDLERLNKRIERLERT